MQVSKRNNITKMPSVEEGAAALATLRGAFETAEQNAQIVLAVAYSTYWSGTEDTRYHFVDQVRATKLPSGVAASIAKCLDRIKKVKPEGDRPKASECLSFATASTADIFAHETKAKAEKARKAKEASEAKKAEAKKVQEEAKAAKAEAERLADELTEVRSERPVYALVDGDGNVAIQLDPTEFERVVKLITTQLQTEKATLKVA